MTATTTPTYTLTLGTQPLLISIPHLGVKPPPECAQQMTAAVTIRQDTDWHLDRPYSFVHPLGISVLQARVSRYVIDLNRPPDRKSLYLG